VLDESGGGITVAPGDAQAMAAAILELRDDPERREALGKAGRRYVEEHYSRAVIAATLERLLGELTAGRNGAS
jgi:glycosyltransferase involved in cell wall biosynthesis